MPLFLLPLLSSAKSIFDAALAFFSKPPGSYIGIAIAFALAVWWFGQHEFNRGVLKCETAHAEAAANEVARERTVIVEVNKSSDARTDIATQINADNKSKVVYIHDKAAALPPSPQCAVPADISDGMRALH